MHKKNKQYKTDELILKFIHTTSSIQNMSQLTLNNYFMENHHAAWWNRNCMNMCACGKVRRVNVARDSDLGLKFPNSKAHNSMKYISTWIVRNF